MVKRIVGKPLPKGLEDYQMLNTKDVSNLVGISVAYLRSPIWRAQAGLPATKIGGTLRFRTADIRHFLDQCREQLEVPMVHADVEWIDAHTAAQTLGLSARMLESAWWRSRVGIKGNRFLGQMRFHKQDISALAERLQENGLPSEEAESREVPPLPHEAEADELTSEEVAALLAVSVRLVESAPWRENCGLPAAVENGVLHFNKADIEAFIAGLKA